MTTQKPAKESDSNSFICACKENMRQVCASEGFYKEHEGKRYCVLHYPGNEKAADFQKALNKKQSAHDYNFNGVWFPQGVSLKELHWDGNTDFSCACFNEDIDFSGAEFEVKALFNNASFNEEVDFSGVSFSEGADFSKASFSKDADFGHAAFGKDADFSDARFSWDASFIEARFSETALFTSSSFSRDACFNYASFGKDAGFISASFRGKARFISVSFSASADFTFASFNKDAVFKSSSFSEAANFISASFSEAADFIFAFFSKDAYFSSAIFNAVADFSFASFSAVAYFGAAIFGAVAFFKNVTFKDYVYFRGQPERKAFGDQTQLSFQPAHLEKPDRISFHALDLKPNWFVNVDSRKFEFTDVEFNYDLKDELERLKKAQVSEPHRLLAIACRQLAVNAEEHQRYRQAADFRYASMDARRLEWLEDRKIKKFQLLHWLYWMASGYGERVTRAFCALVVLWLLFAFSYTVVGFEHKAIKPGNDQQSIAAQDDDVGNPLPFKKVFTYSLGVMSLQKPDPKPVTIAAQTLVYFETILCPIQAALLALAIRRRFKR